MKAKKFLWVLLSFVLVLSLAAFAACETDTNDDDNNGDNNDPSAVEVTEVSLDKTELSLEVGEEATLVATVKPDDATDKTVTWSTSDSKVASVSGGKVTAVSEGEATITAKAGDKSATCSVTVSDGLTDASLVGEWVTDRHEPESWEIKDGKITVTTLADQTDDFYAWEGKKIGTNMSVSGEWKITSAFEVTQELLDREDRVDSALWLNLYGEDGAIYMSYAAVNFHMQDGSAVWQRYNPLTQEADYSDEWLGLEGSTAVGTHEIEISFKDGTITIKIDGEVAGDNAVYALQDGDGVDMTDVTESRIYEVMINTHSYGDSYTVTWDVPEVSYAPVTATTEEELQSAVSAAQDGSVILVGGEIALTKTVDLSGKAVTVKGLEGSKITVSGSVAAFNMQTGGSTLDGLTIEKTDKTSVDGLIMLGTDGTVKNCTITGQYELGDDEVVRGIVQYAGSQDITITGNTFTALRQPAYLEGSGTVSGNTVSGTRGFVVTGNSTIVLEDNEFSDNAVDIAIIPNNQTTNNYEGETVSLSAENNNCFVENQLSKERCKDGETLETYTE